MPLPPDFNVFWKQAAQQGYKPKLATVAKVLLFPSDVTALGSLVNNVATDAWWTPNMPWKSSLTGQTCAEIAAAFTSATGSQWVQALSNYSLFEVAYAAMTSVNNPHDKTEVAAALFKVNIEGVAGQLNWTSSKNPAPGVVDTPCVGRAVEAELQVRLVNGGRRQYADAGGTPHRHARADEQMTG